MPTGKARPGDWNSDMIWLLERLVGLLHDQGKGTDSASIPRGSPSDQVLHYVRGVHTTVSTTEETAITLPPTTQGWLLLSMTYHVTGGSAASFAPRIGQAAAFAADGPDDRVAIAAQSVSLPVNVVFCRPVPLHADSSGRVYLRPGFDAGVDNGGVYQLWLIEAYETQESSP